MCSAYHSLQVHARQPDGGMRQTTVITKVHTELFDKVRCQFLHGDVVPLVICSEEICNVVPRPHLYLVSSFRPVLAYTAFQIGYILIKGSKQFVSLKTNRSAVRHSAILHPSDLEKVNCQQGRKRVTIWQPNSFINPHIFAHHHFSKFPIFLRIALILRPICVNLLKLLCHVSIIS